MRWIIIKLVSGASAPHTCFALTCLSTASLCSSSGRLVACKNLNACGYFSIHAVAIVRHANPFFCALPPALVQRIALGDSRRKAPVRAARTLLVRDN
jgi:hypothetical protein